MELKKKFWSTGLFECLEAFLTVAKNLRHKMKDMIWFSFGLNLQNIWFQDSNKIVEVICSTFSYIRFFSEIAISRLAGCLFGVILFRYSLYSENDHGNILPKSFDLESIVLGRQYYGWGFYFPLILLGFHFNS